MTEEHPLGKVLNLRSLRDAVRKKLRWLPSGETEENIHNGKLAGFHVRKNDGRSKHADQAGASPQYGSSANRALGREMKAPRKAIRDRKS